MTRDGQDIVIIGSGIVGLCCAYYSLELSPSSRVTVLEASTLRDVAGGASSYAGGFIAGGPSWHDPSSQDLARESWKCHVQLAHLLDGERNYGWRECGAIGLSVGHPVNRSAYRTLPQGNRLETVQVEKGKLPPGEWVEGEKEHLSLEGGVGQVDPSGFCQTLFRHLSTTYKGRFSILFGQAKSLHRIYSRSTPPNRDSSSTVPKDSSETRDRPLSTLTFSPYASDDDDSSPAVLNLPYDSLVVAAGPWSAQVCEQLGLPSIPITNLPGHSLIIRPSLETYVPAADPNTLGGEPKALPSGAVFAGIDGGVGGVHGDSFGLARGLSDEERQRGYTRAPELFVRKNGVVYVAGENSIPASASAPTNDDVASGLPNKLPATVDRVKEMVDAECVERLKRAAGAVSPFLKEENGAVIERTQFCYRPISSDREPIVGFIESNVLVATGHGPWGITLAPGTGKVVAEMMLGWEKHSADVTGLSPERFGIHV